MYFSNRLLINGRGFYKVCLHARKQQDVIKLKCKSCHKFLSFNYKYSAFSPSFDFLLDMYPLLLVRQGPKNGNVG